MLLRSYSAPILNSWISSSKHESDVVLRRHSRNRSVSLFAFQNHHPKNPNTRRKSGSDGREPDTTTVQKGGRPPATRKPRRIKEKGDPSPSKRVFFSSGLEEGLMNDGDGERIEVAEMVIGGDDGGGGRGSDGGYGSYDWDHEHGYGSNNTDAYYQNMIEANPGNTLLLGNYAKFLKEVKGDYEKAEEYCGRAILECGIECDGNIMCLYADLIWKTQKDADRAQTYFNQAVKTHPNDCYVLASYARFLWDAEEENGEYGF